MYSDVTILIVAYNSNELLIKCVKNLEKFHVIIIDNGKNEKILPKISSENKNINIISKNKNLGFGKAINFACEHIKTKFFIILNADTFINENSVQKLLETLKKHKNCGAVAPFISLNEDGYNLFPENGKGVQRNNQQKKISDNLHNFKPDGEVCVEVAKLGLMINLENFLKIGKFDENFFMFWEEVELCKRFRKNNFSVIVNPEATIIHDIKKSSKNNLNTFIIKTYHSELSPLYYFKVNKRSPQLFKRLFKYFFRTFSYLLILNLKKSLKNNIKFIATLKYMLN